MGNLGQNEAATHPITLHAARSDDTDVGIFFSISSVGPAWGWGNAQVPVPGCGVLGKSG